MYPGLRQVLIVGVLIAVVIYGTTRCTQEQTGATLKSIRTPPSPGVESQVSGRRCEPVIAPLISRVDFPGVVLRLNEYLQNGTISPSTIVAKGDVQTPVTAMPQVIRWVEVGALDCSATSDFVRTFMTRNPQVTLHTYVVDSWGRRNDTSNDHNDDAEGLRNIKACQTKLGGIPNVKLIRNLSVEAAATVPDGFFDFVYIDALHSYAASHADFDAWYPKLRPYGFLGGDDVDDELLVKWNRFTRERDLPLFFEWGVVRAVQELAFKHNVAVGYTLAEYKYATRSKRYAGSPNFYLLKAATPGESEALGFDTGCRKVIGPTPSEVTAEHAI